MAEDKQTSIKVVKYEIDSFSSYSSNYVPQYVVLALDIIKTTFIGYCIALCNAI